MLLGLARKKLGDVVFYRSEGQQRSRVRVRDIKNPRSAKQSMQRMILATAAKMAAAYEPIVNHSFEGVAVGVDSVRHFRSLAMQALRAAASLSVSENPDAPVADYAIKGAPIVGGLDGLPISRGSLSMKSPGFNSNEDFGFNITYPLATITTQAQYEAALEEIGLVPGDQLTLVQLMINTNIPVATFDRESNHAQGVRFARVTFKAELPENFSGALVIDDHFNPALIESQQGNMLAAVDEQGFISFSLETAGFNGIMSACLIRSQKEQTGKFKYSSANMISLAANFDWNNSVEVYPSYMDGVEEINVGDTLYLRNAVATAE